MEGDFNKLLSTARHELCNPLNAIIGFSSTLLMQLAGPLNKDQMDQLSIIKNSGSRLLALVDDIIDLIKLEHDSTNINTDVVNFLKLINDEIHKLSPFAQAKGLEINIKSSAEDTGLKTDSVILSKIIYKLLDNAIKYTDQGEVSVVFEKINLNKSGFVCIHIQDTGVGIKKEDEVKLFKAFERIKIAGKYIEGAGLGLHLSRRLAKLINGEIKYLSEYGKGSRFTICLPL